MSNDPERIISVAVMVGEKAFVSPVEPYMHWRHHSLLAEMDRCRIPIPLVGDQGFQTSAGRFVNRIEALAIATASGQLKEPTGYGELFSEDLW